MTCRRSNKYHREIAQTYNTHVYIRAVKANENDVRDMSMVIKKTRNSKVLQDLEDYGNIRHRIARNLIKQPIEDMQMFSPIPNLFIKQQSNGLIKFIVKHKRKYYTTEVSEDQFVKLNSRR